MGDRRQQPLLVKNERLFKRGPDPIQTEAKLPGQQETGPARSTGAVRPWGSLCGQRRCQARFGRRDEEVTTPSIATKSRDGRVINSCKTRLRDEEATSLSRTKIPVPRWGGPSLSKKAPGQSLFVGRGRAGVFKKKKSRMSNPTARRQRCRTEQRNGVVNLQSDLSRDKARGEDSIVATLTAKVACEGGDEGGAARKNESQ